jgi:hypothetical protein
MEIKKIVHIIEIQYFKEITANLKNTHMHDLYSIYVKVRKSGKEALNQYLVSGQNLAI